MTAQTPFDAGSGPSLLCGPPKLTEIAAAKSVSSIGLSARYSVQSKGLNIGLDKEVGPGVLDAELSCDLADVGMPDYELGYSASLARGRVVRATLSGAAAAVQYVDTTIEKGATWTAKATTSFGNLRSGSKLTVLRKWTFSL